VQLGEEPMSGKFRIVCPGPTNNDIAMNPYTTEDINLGASADTVLRAIERNCSDTYYKIDVWGAGTYSYSANGISFYVRFIGSNGVKS
jgi:hypothetical protein